MRNLKIIDHWLHGTGQGKSIRVVSECVFPLQLIDWGKNRQNVDRVRTCLTASLAGALSEP